MGGALGGIFSKVGQGALPQGAPPGTPTPPSFLQKLVQGTAAGAGKGLGTSMQTQGRTPGNGGGASLPGAPSATPVDSGYFAPTPMPPGAMRPPGAMPPSPSPFYAQ
jgi:hypothetical protein